MPAHPAHRRPSVTSAAVRQRRRRARLAAGVMLVHVKLDAETLDTLARLNYDVSSAEALGRDLAATLVTRDGGGRQRC
jgi:hypothetical protein